MKARNIQVDIPVAGGTHFQAVASPLRFSATPLDFEQGPPQLGEHTAQVLQTHLGLDAQQQAALRSAGII